MTDQSDRGTGSSSSALAARGEHEDGAVVQRAGGSGRMTPVRARTMKEYEQQIADLQKENFSLKLRIYFLEERMKKNGIPDEDVYNINIELKVEVESLKKELLDKQELLKKASNALETVASQHEVELQQARQQAVDEYRAKALSETADLSDTSVLADQQATSAEVEKLQLQLEESTRKLHELIAINRKLDADCCQLITEKRALEIRLNVEDASADDNTYMKNVSSDSEPLMDKDEVVDQLHCALKAKNVIIEQLEEEKRDALSEASHQFEMKITELNDKLRALESTATDMMLDERRKIEVPQTSCDEGVKSDVVQMLQNVTDECQALREKCLQLDDDVHTLNDRLKLAQDVIAEKDYYIEELEGRLDSEKQQKPVVLDSEFASKSVETDEDVYHHLQQVSISPSEIHSVTDQVELSAVTKPLQELESCNKDDAVNVESLTCNDSSMNVDSSVQRGGQIHSGEAESQSATVSVAVADVSIQVQLESWDDEELRQLRDEVKMLRMKCQRSSDLIAFSPASGSDNVSCGDAAGSSNVEESAVLLGDEFTQMTGSCEDHPQASELKILVPQEGDLFDTTRSCQHPHHSSCEDADDQCNNSSGSSAGVTTALTRTTDALVNQSADSTDLLSAGSVTETQEDARETAEVDNVELDKCLAAFTHDSDGLDVVECDTASANKLDTVQSVELAETLDTNDDISDVIESDEVSTKVSGGAATVESPECYDVLSAADRLSTDHHIACVEECRPDSSEPHIIADTVESTGDGGDAGRPAAAVSSVISSSDEHINMLHSLISQLKSAVSSAHSVENQDTEKLILVMMENIVRHLEDLDHASSVGQQRSFNKAQSEASDVQIKCDSTVPEESQTADQHSWTTPAAETDDVGSHQRRVNTSSSSGIVTSRGSCSPISENLQNKSHADKSHETDTSGEILRLRAEVNSVRADLRRSDNTVLLLKRHIELNTAADGSPLPSFSPDVIVALALEVENLKAELEKLSVEGRSNEHMRGLVSEAEPASGDASSVSDGHCRPADQDKATSSLSMQSLDSTLTGDAAAVDGSMRQKSSSVVCLHQLHDKARDKLPTEDALLSCDGAAAGDRTTTSVDPSLAACFNFITGQTSLLASPAARNILRQSAVFIHSPFESTDAANQRAFAELQAEVERLRRRLQLTELENSRLLEQSARESVGSFLVVASGRPSINSHADVSLSLDGSLVKYSASGDVTMAVGFLKKLVSTHRRDRACLQRHIAEGHETCRLLRTRMEELVDFLEELISVTPAQGQQRSTRRELIVSCLNETRELLAEVVSKHIDYDTEDVSVEMTNLELELSSLVDLDLTTARFDETEEQVEEHQHGVMPAESHHRDTQEMIKDLMQKLSATDQDCFSSRCRVSELTRDLESTNKSLSERESELTKYEQQNRELASTVEMLRTRADELQHSLTKARTKNEELSRIRHEIETVLVEQEKQVMTYEEQIKQITMERNSEVDLARQRDAETQQVIASLREECQSQQKNIDVLDGLVQQLRDQLDQEKCAAVTRDNSSRSGVQDRDAMIAKLKALVRENQSTADRLKEELRRMNEEAKDKNRTIARLRQSCEELSARCAELEAALCRTSLDISHSQPEFTRLSSHLLSDAVDFRQSLGKDRRNVGSETSIELIRHAHDYDGKDVDLWRQRHISATQVSAPSGVADGSSYISDAGSNLPSYQPSSQGNLPRSRSAGNLATLADGDGFVTEESELSAIEALSATRQQLLSAELELISLKQRLEEATAVSQALRLELQLHQHLARTTDDDKENSRGVNGAASSGDFASILQEVYQLRVQLERCISSNDRLRHTLRKSGSITAYAVDNSVMSANLRDTVANVLTTGTVDVAMNNDIPTSSATEHGSDNGSADRTASGGTSVAMTQVRTTSDTLNAVMSHSSFEQLKTEVERCHTTLAQLDSAVHDALKQLLHTSQASGAGVGDLLSSLWQSMRTLRQVICSFQLIADVHSQADEICSLRHQNATLRQQLVELRQRYTRAKQAMKVAQERLDAHSRKKEELMRQQHKNNDEAIIAQINKTRQVLAETSRNLESHHSAAAKPDGLQK